MRKWLWLAWVAVIVMTVVSAAFNFIFGWRIGENSHTISTFFHDGYIYGALSIAADGFKIAFGVLTVAFFMARGINPFLRALGVMLCGVLWILSTGYALNSAFGSVATNRTDMAGIREAKSTNYEAIDRQLKHVQQQREWLEKHRASATIEAEMSRERQASLWTRSAGCTNATASESRSFCQNYFALVAELGTAKRDDELATQGQKLQQQLAGAGGKMIADPHAKMMHDLSGYSETAIVLGWLLLLVALVEGGSTIGPIALYLVHQNAVRQPVAKNEDAIPSAPRMPLQPRAEMTPNPLLQKALAAAAQPVARTEAKEEEKPLSFQKPVLVRPAPVPVDKPREDALPIVRSLNLVVDNEPPKHFQPVVNFDREGNDDFPQKYRGKKAKGPSALAHSRQSASVRKWLGMCSTDNHKKTCANSDDVWAAYTAWLEATGEHGFTYRKAMIAELGRVYFKGGRNGRTSRNAKGPKFPGLIPYHPVVEKQRARA